MGAAGLVDLEEVEAAVAVGDLDTDVVAVDAHGPVGNTVGVDEAAQDANGGRVLLVGSDACASASASTTGNGDGCSGGSSGSKESSDGSEHFEGWKQVKCFVKRECLYEKWLSNRRCCDWDMRAKEWTHKLQYEGMNRSKKDI